MKHLPQVCFFRFVVEVLSFGPPYFGIMYNMYLFDVSLYPEPIKNFVCTRFSFHLLVSLWGLNARLARKIFFMGL